MTITEGQKIGFQIDSSREVCRKNVRGMSAHLYCVAVKFKIFHEPTSWGVCVWSAGELREGAARKITYDRVCGGWEVEGRQALVLPVILHASMLEYEHETQQPRTKTRRGNYCEDLCTTNVQVKKRSEREPLKSLGWAPVTRIYQQT